MLLELTKDPYTWLNKHNLSGYLCVVDALPHPKTQEIARRVHLDTINNNQIRLVLGLQRGEEHDIEASPQNIIEEYFAKYSVSAKVYRTHDGPNKCWEIGPSE